MNAIFQRYCPRKHLLLKTFVILSLELFSEPIYESQKKSSQYIVITAHFLNKHRVIQFDDYLIWSTCFWIPSVLQKNTFSIKRRICYRRWSKKYDADIFFNQLTNQLTEYMLGPRSTKSHDILSFRGHSARWGRQIIQYDKFFDTYQSTGCLRIPD